MGHILTGNQLDVFLLATSNGVFFKGLVTEDGIELWERFGKSYIISLYIRLEK